MHWVKAGKVEEDADGRGGRELQARNGESSPVGWSNLFYLEPPSPANRNSGDVLRQLGERDR